MFFNPTPFRSSVHSGFEVQPGSIPSPTGYFNSIRCQFRTIVGYVIAHVAVFQQQHETMGSTLLPSTANCFVIKKQPKIDYKNPNVLSLQLPCTSAVWTITIDCRVKTAAIRSYGEQTCMPDAHPVYSTFALKTRSLADDAVKIHSTVFPLIEAPGLYLRPGFY